MTRERWEQVLFAHVQDEVVQDMLNGYVLQLEAENAKLRKYAELYAGVVKPSGCDICPYCDDFDACGDTEAVSMSDGCALYMEMRELRIEVPE